MTPEYWAKAKKQLRQRDPVLAKIIARHPRSKLEVRGEPYLTLCRSIVGQQISVKAAATIWERFVKLVPELRPELVLQVEIASLRAAGLSERKCQYIRDLSRHFGERILQIENWPKMSDEEIIQDLIRVKGIGRWSAEMFLMFNLLRPNVLPLDDVGLQRAIKLAYKLRRTPSKEKIRKLSKAWEPYRSVATWYLWRSLEPVGF